MAGERVVLVPLDQSPVSEGALPYAEALAKALSAGVRLLLVLPQARSASRQAAKEPDQDASGRYLAAAERLRASGTSVSRVFTQGQPAEEILRAAGEPEVVLVVMATHGRGGVERWLVGSVADTVMRTCGRPTLLVVPSEAPPAVELRRVMVPLDGSPRAEAALPLAVEIAAGSGATVTLVKAMSRMAAPGTFVPNLADWEHEMKDAAKAYLEAIRSRLPASLKSEALVLLDSSSPASLLAGFAQTEGVDLIVMSTHGYGGFRRLALGSMADQLVRSAVPAILVRPPVVEPEGNAQPPALHMLQTQR